MDIDRAKIVQEWLMAEGQSRIKAMQEASCLLLRDYFTSWDHLIPIELHRLAASLHAKIVRLSKLKGDAIIQPSQGGFRILVNGNYPIGRYRTSVAHELVHTLFYTDVHENSTPQRFIPHSQKEEHFCFDVSRYLLAPKEHLDAIGIFHEKDPEVMFNKLTSVLLLSRPWAARIMLADYVLARGIAGRWVRTYSGWKQEYSSSTASPCLSERDRKKLRIEASNYLQHPESQSRYQQITAVKETSEDAVFLLVTTH